MIEAIALCGWLAAAVAVAAATCTRRSLALRAEAVAVACHELCGPLTAVRLGLELGARRGQLSDARLRAIELELGRASLALEDLSETRRGRRSAVGAAPQRPVAAEASTVHVGELLADSVEAWRPTAAARGVELRLRWPGGPARVLGDRLRLAQATGNLIANAIEHGGGTVAVGGRADRLCVRIEVVDDGPGLSAPVAELVRSRRRGRKAASRARGRGLAIAGAVAAAHGGRLASVPSERGAKLVLELPPAGGAELSTGRAADARDRPRQLTRSWRRSIRIAGPAFSTNWRR